MLIQSRAVYSNSSNINSHLHLRNPSFGQLRLPQHLSPTDEFPSIQYHCTTRFPPRQSIITTAKGCNNITTGAATVTPTADDEHGQEDDHDHDDNNKKTVSNTSTSTTTNKTIKTIEGNQRNEHSKRDQGNKSSHITSIATPS